MLLRLQQRQTQDFLTIYYMSYCTGGNHGGRNEILKWQMKIQVITDILSWCKHPQCLQQWLHCVFILAMFLFNLGAISHICSIYCTLQKLYAYSVLKQASWQCHIGQFVIGFSAATETHSVPAVIPRHYPVTFLNCNTHSGPSSGIAT